MTPPTTRTGRVLYFLNLLGDTDPMCLSWTKVGLALSTIFAAVTGAATAAQQFVEATTHTDWGLFAAAIGLHGICHGAARIKRQQKL